MARRAKAETKDIDMFAPEEPVEESSEEAGGLPVVEASFGAVRQVPMEKLWQGYSELYAITFSYSLDLINEIADNFERMEIILGNELIVGYEAAMLMAHEEQDLREINRRPKLVQLVKEGRLELSKTRDVHAKIFLLRGEGKTRVITGSANLSRRAFNGTQLENYICFDDEAAFLYYKGFWDELRKKSSTEITIKSLYAAEEAGEGLSIEELPIVQEVKVNKAGVIVDDNKAELEALRFVTDVTGLSKEYASVMPRLNTTKGLTVIKPEKIDQLTRLYKDKVAEREQKKEEQVLPEFRVDYGRECCFLNDIPYDMEPDMEDVRKDIAVLHTLLDGYDSFFGNVAQGKRTMYLLLVFMFVSPFLPRLRLFGKKYGFGTMPFPYFVVLKGKRNAGKSFMVKNYQMLMFKKDFPDVNNDKFTRTKIEPFLLGCKGVPLEIEDLTAARMDKYAKDIIKSDTWIIEQDIREHASFIITTNEIQSLSSEIAKRAIFLETPIENENKNIVASCKKYNDLVKGSKSAFYMEFMRRMIPAVNALTERMQTYSAADAAEEWFPDIFAIGSRVIMDIYDACGVKRPDFVRKVTYYTYSDNEDNLQTIKKEIVKRWEHDQKAFRVNARSNTLEYDTGESLESARTIAQLLPMRLSAEPIGTKVVMKLREAEEFFDVLFCSSMLERLWRRVTR